MEFTTGDIQKISLYIPFKVEFSPKEKYSLFTRYFAKGIIGSTVIERWNEEDGDLEDYSDIGHSDNTDLPILRRLDSMTEDEMESFESLTHLHPNYDHIEQISDHILTNATPEVTFYALSKHFDIFGLIDQGKALDRSKLRSKN